MNTCWKLVLGLTFVGCSHDWSDGRGETGAPDGQVSTVVREPIDGAVEAEVLLIDGSVPPTSSAQDHDGAPSAEAGSPAPGELSVTLAATTRTSLVRGLERNVAVSVQRSGSFAGDVLLAVSNLPAGVIAEPLTVPKGSAEATLKLRAAASASLGPATITLTAVGAGAPPFNTQLPLLVQDAPGTLDVTFGNGGKMELPLGSHRSIRVNPGAIAIAPDDRVVVCGEVSNAAGTTQFMAARVTTSGAADATFASGGVLAFNAPNPRTLKDMCLKIVILPSGALLAAGLADGIEREADVMITRLTSGGALDTSFAGTGLVRKVAPNGQPSKAHSLVLLPDGKMLVGGFESYPAMRTLLLRFLSDGSLDSTFGDGAGRALGELGNAYSLGVQSSGALVTTHPLNTSSVDGTSLNVVRYTSSGRLDPTFGTMGYARSVVPIAWSGTRAYDVHVLRDDGLLAIGHVLGPSNDMDIAVTRFTKDGDVDRSYGSAGIASFHFQSGASTFAASTQQSDGALLIAGSTPLDGKGVATIIRLTPSGAVDTTFGPAGRRTLDEGGAQAVAVDNAGRLVVVGRDPTETRAWVYRLWL